VENSTTTWPRRAAAVVLALGLLTATGTSALAGPLKCDNASWDCTVTTTRKAKAPKPLTYDNASWDTFLTTSTNSP
jgi:hypothetical protein